MPEHAAAPRNDDPACPVRIEPNDDRGWLDRDPTVDEQEVVAHMRQGATPRRILHVGIGGGYLTREFGANVIQGITKDGGELRHARSLGLDAILCNKYDVASYRDSLAAPFDCIVDVNIRSYSCCDTHFQEFMELMRASLGPGGALLTSRRGLDYLRPTPLGELERMCSAWAIAARGNVVLMRPKTPGILERALNSVLGRKTSRPRAGA